MALVDSGQADPVPNRAERDDVVLLMGYDAPKFGDEAGRSTREIEPAEQYLSDLGYSPVETWGFYVCDVGFDEHISRFGDHAGYQGGSDGHGGDAGDCSGEPANSKHSRDAKIPHLAYHLAWALYHDKYEDGDCPVVFAHSMGGLLVRYALMAVESTKAEYSEFPPHLCIDTVVTLGTPHAGAKWTEYCDDNECNAMTPGSALLKKLADEGMHPEGEGGTMWVAIGSDDDGVVTPDSSVSMTTDLALVYGAEENIDHCDCGESESSYWAFTKGTATAQLQWFDQRNEVYETESGNFPFRLGDLAHFGSGWDCGMIGDPWPIKNRIPLSGDAAPRGCRYSLYRGAADSAIIETESTNDKVLPSVNGGECVQGALPGIRRCFIESPSAEYISFDVRKSASSQTVARFGVNASAYNNAAPSAAEAFACEGLEKRGGQSIGQSGSVYAPAYYVADPGMIFSCTGTVRDDSLSVWSLLAVSDENGGIVAQANQTSVWPARPSPVVNVTPPGNGTLVFHWTAGDGRRQADLMGFRDADIVRIASVPSAPKRLSFSAADNSISWEPGFDGYHQISSYNIYETSPITFAPKYVDSQETSGPWVLPEGINRSVAHTLEVRAVNRLGEGASATVQIAAKPQPPPIPPSFTWSTSSQGVAAPATPTIPSFDERQSNVENAPAPNLALAALVVTLAASAGFRRRL